MLGLGLADLFGDAWLASLLDADGCFHIYNETNIRDLVNIKTTVPKGFLITGTVG